ncbi:MAG: antitoxin VapB family protein [archaeon]|nr:MAG: antitoxin VapB family protein [archaeon]
MPTKTLAIREEVYRKLAGVKRAGESFSDLIERILDRKEDPLALWGALSDSEHLAKLEKESRAIRNGARSRT